MTPRLRARAPFLALIAVAACESPRSPAAACIDSIQAAIIGGSAASDAGVNQAVAAAIGRIETDAAEVLCTATLVADRFALTAAHCDRSEGVFFRVGDSDGASFRAQVIRSYVHPRLDVMLAELGVDDAMAIASLTTHLDLFSKAEGAPWPTHLTIAGRGQREDGMRGELRFASEPVQAVTADTLTVQGNGVSGACGGDSGGPLLLVTSDGKASIVGLLARGSSDCRGLDVYTRADRIASWVADTLARVAAADCGNLSAMGVCTEAGPRWCVGLQLHAAACSGKQLCGFDRVQGRYGCVDSEADPCLGIAAEWTCLGNARVRCENQTTLQTHPCGSCGTCMLTARGPECVPLQER